MRIPNILIAASIAIGVVACSNIFQNEDTPVPYNSEDPMKSGEISLPVKPDPIFTWAPQPGVVNLGGLKSKSGGQPVLVVLGESVAAGYRDGGLFREGQITSYPNLVARQMGLTNFKQPLFERENGNGTGRLVVDGATEGFRWKEVTNNLAYKDRGTSIEFKPYLGDQVNNFSAPGLNPGFFAGNPSDLLTRHISYYQNNPLSAEEDNVNYLWHKKAMSLALASRFIPSGSGTGWDRINALKPDFGIVDAGLDVFVLNHIRGEGPGLSTNQRSPAWELQLLNMVSEAGMKYVYTTIPDVLDFPYFKLYSYDEVVKKTGSIPQVLVSGHVETQALRPNDILLPTANVVNYVNGKFRGTLADTDVIRAEEAGSAEFYNRAFIQVWSKRYGHPLVDFHAVYKKVLSGQYVTEDGFQIDPSFPNGNFFSTDGIYPSAIGQAVLANEVIKVFNTSFSMGIPLIDVGEYATELGNK